MFQVLFWMLNIRVNKIDSVAAKSLQLCLTMCNTMDYSPARPLCSWDFPGNNTGVGCHALPPGDLPNLGIEPVSL